MLIICKFSISCDVYMEIESLKNTFRASPRLASIHEFLFLQAWRKYFIPRFVFRPGPLRPRGHKYLSLSAFLQIASLASQLLCLITCIYSSMARLLHSRTKIQFCHFLPCCLWDDISIISGQVRYLLSIKIHTSGPCILRNHFVQYSTTLQMFTGVYGVSIGFPCNIYGKGL